jgi:hypothetical protein
MSSVNKTNYYHKEVNVVIIRQEAEGSLADANDCLRSVKGKLIWFHQKQLFCPHLITIEDSTQVQSLIDRITSEEKPILEFDQKLKSGLVSHVSRDLEIRFNTFCQRFSQIKQMLQILYNNIELIIETKQFVNNQ